MPGGYGTSGPWGSAGTSYVSSGQSSSPYQSGAGSTNQGGSNAVADAINEQKYKQSNEYLNNADNFLNPQEQYAVTLAAYNKKYGVAGGSVGLGSSGAMYYTDVPDVYYSTYVPGTQGHSPTGYQKITGPGLLSINGVPISGEINRSIYNPHGGSSGGSGGGGGSGYGRYGGWGGSSQYGNPLGRYSKANWHLKNKYNYDSPIAALFAERRANPVQPQDIRLFTEMMANMNKGGIIGLRR